MSAIFQFPGSSCALIASPPIDPWPLYLGLARLLFVVFVVAVKEQARRVISKQIIMHIKVLSISSLWEIKIE